MRRRSKAFKGALGEVAKFVDILLDIIFAKHNIEVEVAYELVKAKLFLKNDDEGWLDHNLSRARDHIFKAMELTENEDLYYDLNSLYVLLNQFLP